MIAMVLGGFILISVSVGGFFAWIVSTFFQKTAQGMSLVCGGFLVGLLVIDILPAALHMYKLSEILLGILLGYLLFLVIHNIAHPKSIMKVNYQRSPLFLVTIALLLHTIPLSLTVGNALGTSTFGLALTASIILHHLPEGFALATVLLSQRKSLWGLLPVFSSLSICFSFFVWVGHYVQLTNFAQATLLGISIGLLAVTSLSEFILHNRRFFSLPSFIFYILIGYLLSYFFHLIM